MGEWRLCLLHLYARCLRVRVQLLACGRSLALNRAELVFLAMLTVSDYTRGVPHVGATTAHLLIRRFLRPRIRALEHSAAFCGVCIFDAADTRALPQDQPGAPLADSSWTPSVTLETGSLRHTS